MEEEDPSSGGEEVHRWQWPDEAPVDLDVLREILTIPYERKDITSLVRVCKLFDLLLRHHMYRHVNLRTLRDAIGFFRAVVNSTNCALPLATISLQISFNLADDDTGDAAAWAGFWQLFKQALIRLSNLKTFTLCYSLGDNAFLDRFITKGELREHFPRSVEKLHLRPLPEEEDLFDLPHDPLRLFQSFNRSDTPNVVVLGPWHEDTWAESLARIPRVVQLIVTTPTHLIWPPTVRHHDHELARWTANLWGDTTLHTIVLNYGYGDGGGSIDDWNQEELNSSWRPEMFWQRNIVGGTGMQNVWTRMSTIWARKVVTEPSNSTREEYFFNTEEKEGEDGTTYLRGWTHINENEHRQEWCSNREGWHNRPVF
ncbi:hypothetical protein B0H16DRAFT_1799721 [Mycena metata]|uniref:Uncharacterized protein n=1 Tax=Mycena metata TaxID=1033252 RepID=A0AAD7JGI0_9AGAR|nr:hypothetical protein B0H16DRAFT_1799721 [Mycena metata]